MNNKAIMENNHCITCEYCNKTFTKHQNYYRHKKITSVEEPIQQLRKYGTWDMLDDTFMERCYYFYQEPYYYFQGLIANSRSMNYGKDSYTTLQNNRTTTKNSSFGNVGGLISNMVDPIVKGLRHSKKTNCVSNSNPIGNMNGANKQPMVYNPNENVSTTNREMYEGKLNMKHLNVQNQYSLLNS